MKRAVCFPLVRPSQPQPSLLRSHSPAQAGFLSLAHTVSVKMCVCVSERVCVCRAAHSVSTPGRGW